MSATGGEANEFERLKTLLFSPEASRLSEAESHIEGLENWVGDAKRLEAATAEILVEAMRRAEVARHRELASAIAPVVVAAIRAEIHNSRDMMVEALYPITGRLVAAAVSNAFNELLDAINQRLDRLVSTDQWRLRLKSIATGRSVAEIALSEARASSYQRILLLERGSGRLLAHWRPDGEREDNPELVSGMVAAISEFASSVLSEQHGELRSLDLGASQVYLRASSRIILAVETLGVADRKLRQRLDAGFVQLVDRHDRGEEIGEEELAALAQTSSAPLKSTRASRIRWVVLAICAALALAWGLRGPVSRWLKSNEIDAAYASALAGDTGLASYPLTLTKDWTAGTVTLRGLAGSEAAVKRVLSAIAPASAPMVVQSHVEIVATSGELESARRAEADAAEERQKAQTSLIGLIDAERSEAVARNARLEAAIAALRQDEAISAADRQRAAAELSGRIDAERRDGEARNATLDAAIVALQRDQARSDAAVSARIESLAAGGAAERERSAASLARLIEDDKAGLAAMGRRVDQLTQALAAVQSSLAGPRRRIAEAAGEAIIVFGERDAPADAGLADKTLDALADVIKTTGEGVRVVGFADESGGVQANLEISRLRAARIVKLLVERGVAADRLLPVGRGAQTPIVDSTSDRQFRNRRVTFEPLFALEQAR